MPNDGMALEEFNGVLNGDGGSRSGARFNGRGGTEAEPAAFDEPDDGVRMTRENGRAALAESHRVAEEKDFSGGSRFLELR